MKFIGRISLVSNYEEKRQNEYFGWRYLRSNDHWMVIHRPDRKVGHCLMLCWQSGRFQIQRSVVRIQSAAKYLYFLQIRLYWDNLKKWFQKMGHSWPLFLIFVFSIQLSLTKQMCCLKYLLMTGFEPRTSCVISEPTTTAQLKKCCCEANQSVSAIVESMTGRERNAQHLNVINPLFVIIKTNRRCTYFTLPNKIWFWAAAIAPWYCMHLPSCGRGFESHANHLCFFKFVFLKL